MKNFWDKLGVTVRHNIPFIAGILVCVMLVVSAYGCVSTVKSISNPEVLVNRAELSLEVDALSAELELQLEQLLVKAQAKNKELNKQDAMKASLFQIGISIAEGGTINPIGMAMTLSSILGIGAIANFREKNKVIDGNKMMSNSANG